METEIETASGTHSDAPPDAGAHFNLVWSPIGGRGETIRLVLLLSVGLHHVFVHFSPFKWYGLQPENHLKPKIVDSGHVSVIAVGLTSRTQISFQDYISNFETS